MSNEMQVEAALANLEAGRFSFRTVDAIKSHIEKMERELAVVQELHGDAIRELKRQEYAVWRLESELTRSNARVYALIRANVLSEATCSQARALASEAKAYGQAGVSKAAELLALLAKKFSDPELRRHLGELGEAAFAQAGMGFRVLEGKARSRLAQIELDRVRKDLEEYLEAAKGRAVSSAHWASAQLRSAGAKLKTRSQDAA
ncbi:MAG: hypothetical protein EKK29_08270 [Hyphomicrobiales bacterium]|jgi:hypothetical protein|nr:MAG: hypothetical protein EKK29_08270 [Hyphomicrobiales bacterium]